MLLLESVLSLIATSSAAADYSDLHISMTRHTQDRYVADLAEVQKRGVLRVVTRNNSEDYFIVRGVERGFQYELTQAFAKEIGVRVEYVVPPSRRALISWLLTGHGDLIAAGMTKTPARAEKVRFTHPLLESSRVIVTKQGIASPPQKVEDLVRFPIHLSFRSTTYRDVLPLADLGVHLVDVTEGLEMEQMMERVAEGEYPATVADSNLVDIARTTGVAVEGRIPVGEPHEKAWAVHPAAADLQAAADRFVTRSRKDGLWRIMRGRYYQTHSKWVRRAAEEEFRADHGGRISAYDALFKKASQDTGMDWRLLAAVAYTESQFDPAAKSRWGAVGLMQVLPSTAKGLGVTKNLDDPAVNVRVGARYLKRLIGYFEHPEIDTRQRIRFALAAYNAGLGHVLDARRLAEETGRDKNRWFGNVEDALLLKRDRKWHSKTRYGYCRAGETTAYVSSIQSRYDVYVRHVPL